MNLLVSLFHSKLALPLVENINKILGSRNSSRSISKHKQIKAGGSTPYANLKGAQCTYGGVVWCFIVLLVPALSLSCPMTVHILPPICAMKR